MTLGFPFFRLLLSFLPSGYLVTLQVLHQRQKRELSKHVCRTQLTSWSGYRRERTRLQSSPTLPRPDAIFRSTARHRRLSGSSRHDKVQARRYSLVFIPAFAAAFSIAALSSGVILTWTVSVFPLRSIKPHFLCDALVSQVDVTCQTLLFCARHNGDHREAKHERFSICE